jgi:hypothetical protein
MAVTGWFTGQIFTIGNSLPYKELSSTIFSGFRGCSKTFFPGKPHETKFESKNNGHAAELTPENGGYITINTETCVHRAVLLSCSKRK